jgi:protein-S-isoprenylcysteine O-methyltransferase Ste14
MATNIKTKDFLFVIIQFLLLTIFFIPIYNLSFQFIHFLKYPGAVISFVGFLIILMAILQLNKNLTPFPTPKTSGILIKTGLYKYMRHPIYTGIFLATLGLGLFNNNLQQISIAVILLILFYFKSSYEEKMLIDKYEEYKKYKENTNRFFPFL